MAFIKRKDLQETMAANPLDAVVAEEADKTKLAQEAILTAVAAETDAINQYTQILEVVNESEQWLVDSVKPTLTDIIDEEKKHLAQLNKLVSDLPAFEEQWAEGWKEAETGEDVSESLEESIAEEASDYLFDIVEVISTISNYLRETAANDPNLGKNLQNIEDDVKALADQKTGLILPQSVDSILKKYNYTIINLDELEERLLDHKLENDIVLKSKAVDEIISLIEELKDASTSVAEKEVFSDVIDYLKTAPAVVDESVEDEVINDDNENFLGPKQDDEDYEVAAEDTLN